MGAAKKKTANKNTSKQNTSRQNMSEQSTTKQNKEKSNATKQAERKNLTKTQRLGKMLEEKWWIVPSVLSVLLFIASIWGIHHFNQFLLYDDEFGYWAASAYLTSTDWKAVTGGIPYYSYGYGFAILTPIRLIFQTPEAMYRAAIVVNGLLLVGSFWLARNVVGQVFEEMNRFAIDVICFTVMMYPANILFAHIAWAESTLVFVFWVFVWTSLRVIKRPSFLNHIGIAGAAIGLYVVHQRTLAVMIATAIIMLWCFIIDKDRRKYIIVFVLAFAFFFWMHSYIKGDLVNTYYNNNSKMGLNNMSGQKKKIDAIFTEEGFKRFLLSITGKWTYLFIATLMMAWWGAARLLKSAFVYLRHFFANIKDAQERRAASKETALWFMWLLLAFAGNFMVAAIYMGVGGRNDCLLYGRYTEYMIGIYFIIGIVAFLQDKRWISKMMLIAIVTLVCGVICQNFYDQDNCTSYQMYHSVCTSLFLENGQSAEDAAMQYTLWGYAVSLVCMLLLKVKLWKKWAWVRYGIAVLLVVVLSCKICYKQVLGTIYWKQSVRVTNISVIINWVYALDGAEEHDIYYCKENESRYWAESFQFLLKDRPLQVVNNVDRNLADDAFYITSDDFVSSAGFDDNYYCIKKTNQFALVAEKDKELAARARALRGGEE